ncbi:GyrI-like domain-containing protein [Hymenobacter cheonanensis]|uniref:GyrI-like domain-containing protein n=1 Tax=Hymenobacter sp. CA2-7 TaxID=3063993 RepID=UPI002712EFC6|nr:GyrI-like domain-containing protein [Hymenobacter sp. CA2-7]MDO7883731.1 GyrI-like domain-containing protein [Hymenobacter sp. CA2-7]
MQPTIKLLPEKKLIGQHQRMSLLTNTTAALWRSFRQRQQAQPFSGSTKYYSVQVYGPGYFNPFRPEVLFEKWAAVEMTQPVAIPPDLEILTLPGGLYAVFLYQGPANAGDTVFSYILQEWLPASCYALDGRPHFEVLGEKYSNEDPASEEEIWIPIKLRSA